MWAIVKYTCKSKTGNATRVQKTVMQGILSEHMWIDEAREALLDAQEEYGGRVAIVLADNVTHVKKLNHFSKMHARNRQKKVNDKLIAKPGFFN